MIANGFSKLENPQPKETFNIPKNISLYLVRHGSTNLNEQNRLRSWLDVPLSDDGQKEAIDLATRFQRENININKIYTSNLIRAQQTTQEITKQTKNPPVEITPLLKPINFGSLNGQPIKQIQPEIDKLMEEWKTNPDAKVNGSESFTEFQNRQLQIFKKIANEIQSGQSFVISAHLRNVLWFLSFALNGLQPLQGNSISLMNRLNPIPASISILTNKDFNDILQIKLDHNTD